MLFLTVGKHTPHDTALHHRRVGFPVAVCLCLDFELHAEVTMQ